MSAAFRALAFPPRYHYDILRALDYFRDAKRQADGRWLLDCTYDGALAFPTGASAGEPSRWNTLRALRVFPWYERRGLEPTSIP